MITRGPPLTKAGGLVSTANQTYKRPAYPIATVCLGRLNCRLIQATDPPRGGEAVVSPYSEEIISGRASAETWLKSSLDSAQD